METQNATERKKRKIKKGIVVSNKMQKTLVVRVQRTLLHPRYGKVITLNKKYYAHYEGNDYKVGDEVSIMETRPMSKLKRWRVVA
ncbi:MAG: 30S ribosomal protein S17 [Parachlamydiales bacterium]|jgi:small subunit ribosomal protein S17